MRKPGPDARPRLPPRPGRGRSPSELDEVERALSVLDGRHPDFVRAQRETRDAARLRTQALIEEAARAWRRRVRRGVLTLLALSVLAALGWSGLQVFSLMRALSQGLDQASAKFFGAGFRIAASSTLLAPHKLEIDSVAPGCFVALTSAPSGEMTVTHGSVLMTRRAHSIGWCACDPEYIFLRAPPSASATEGVRLIRVESRALGGREGWALQGPVPEAFSAGGESCDESALVGWIADRRFPREPVDGRWLESGTGAQLVRAGFQAVASSSVGRPFAVVESAIGSCLIAMRPARPLANDPLQLEEMGGAVVAHGRSLLWCDPFGHARTVRSSGENAIVVVAAPSLRIGGLLGAREWAARAGASDVVTSATAEELAGDAAASLRASGLVDVSAIHASSEALFVGVSLRASTSLVHDAPPKGTVLVCEPSLESGALQAICVQIGSQPWLPAAGETIGLAAAPVPFWLTALAEQRDPNALHAELRLLALARRLTSEGFEPTMFSGVKEAAPGRISVMGLAHDDAIVAVEVMTEQPWVIPYTDGPHWSMDGEPRIVPLTAGSRVTLTAHFGAEAPEKQRRTIVFRRSHTR